MSDYLYYLSYARRDRDKDQYNVIRNFQKELEEEVGRLTGRQDRVGFFDGRDIEPGEIWSSALSEALCTSRVFVPIYSLNYFNSPHCGREWAVFTKRIEEYKNAHPSAKVNQHLIQPILFVAEDELEELPDAVSRIQYLDETYPMDYRDAGLHVMSRVGAFRDGYEQFKYALAKKIVNVAAEDTLPPLDPCPDIVKVTSAFEQPRVQALGTSDRRPRQPERLIQSEKPQLWDRAYDSPGEGQASARQPAPEQPDVLSPETIFISYSRKDWDEFVEPLVKVLRQRGLAVWIDQLGIKGGTDWGDVIDKALKTCQRMVVCVSPNSMESNQAKKEYRYFLKRNKTIIPLLCRESDNTPYDIDSIQYIPYEDRIMLIEELTMSQ